MKKVLATTILSMLAINLMIEPACAILEKKADKQTQQTTILDTVNFDWWKKQNDEHLEKYIVSAINNNYDIKTTALKIKQAQINVIATRAGQLPTISVGASPVLAKMPGETKTMGSFALPIMASWELDLFGKNWDKTKSSKKLLYACILSVYTAKSISLLSLLSSLALEPKRTTLSNSSLCFANNCAFL